MDCLIGVVAITLILDNYPLRKVGLAIPAFVNLWRKVREEYKKAPTGARHEKNGRNGAEEIPCLPREKEICRAWTIRL